jgi:hypothetical protein
VGGPRSGGIDVGVDGRRFRIDLSPSSATAGSAKVLIVGHAAADRLLATCRRGCMSNVATNSSLSTQIGYAELPLYHRPD